MVRFWGDDRDIERARLAVESLGLPGRWLDGAALDARQVPTRGEPYGRAVFLLEAGALFAPSFMGGAVRGMHGYDVDSPSAFAAIASNRPIPAGCDALTDLAPWIRSLLGLPARSVALAAARA
jgi:hypothetical protein